MRPTLLRRTMKNGDFRSRIRLVRISSRNQAIVLENSNRGLAGRTELVEDPHCLRRWILLWRMDVDERKGFHTVDVLSLVRVRHYNGPMFRLHKLKLPEKIAKLRNRELFERDMKRPPTFSCCLLKFLAGLSAGRMPPRGCYLHRKQGGQGRILRLHKGT